MKKIRLFLVFAISAIFISGLFAQEMTYSKSRDGSGISIGLELKSYNIQTINYRSETMHEIELSGIFIPNDEGMPNLPRISRFVAIPNGADVNVSIKYIETETVENINIAPAIRIQAIPEEPITDYVKNDEIYLKNEFYPQIPYEISEVTSLRGVSAVVVGITPFQYNPVTKELIVIKEIELDIEYVGGTRDFGDIKYRSPWFDPILKNSFLNYDVLPDIEYKGKSHRDGTGCEYLIIIPNRADFQPLANQIKEFRTKQGIYTQVKRLDEMGVTTTAQLKTYIHNAYSNWDIPPVAILFMGDHNTNMALGIPAETISHPYSGTCITDNQYAEIVGNNNLPDIVLGRMAAETEAQMAVLVSKFLEYETQPCMTPSYYQNPITALGWQTVRWFQICSEAVGGYWRNMGKTPVRVNDIYEGTPGSSWSSAQNTAMVTNYFGPNGTGYIPESPSTLGGWSGGTASHVVNAVNNGAFVLQHRDHGFENGWGEPAFQSSHISQLNNVGKMTYLFTINCLTGKFNHSSPCFGEVFHRHTFQGQNAGCVGFLGPTEISYSFVNDAFTWGMYDLYDPAFLPTFGPMGPHSATYQGYWLPAFGNVAGKYFLYQSNWPYNTGDKIITYKMFTAHSDVFLRLFTEVPQEIDVFHSDVHLAGNPDFLITVNQGVTIALTVDGEIIAVSTGTGIQQSIEIPSNLLPTEEIIVVCTGQNYLRYESVVTVVPAEGPYVVCTGYNVVNENVLTYISENSEIAVTLKNVGVEPTTGVVSVEISSADPQINITTSIAECDIINPDETATVNFNVTINNDIIDGKTFPVTVTVTQDSETVWVSRMNLKAYAPNFSLEKVLIDGVEGGNLKKGDVVRVTAIVANKGGAEAFGLNCKLNSSSPFVNPACEEEKREIKNLPGNESMNFEYIFVTDMDMPFGHVANFNLQLSANYELTYSAAFTASCTGSENYCIPGNTGCNSGDKFTNVVLWKTSEPANLLINNQDGNCINNGYSDFTSTFVELEPGQYYTIKVKCVNYQAQVRGWFDLNGNNVFDDNEMLININLPPNQELTQNFIIPENLCVPGIYRFRLRCQYSTTAPQSCNGYTYGQTHDYTIVIPEKYPRVQNLLAELSGSKIILTWEEPESETYTPIGYKVYRNGIVLNDELLTVTTFTETDLEEGVYVYYVSAVYESNKESYTQMSNVICFDIICELPINVEGESDEGTAIITWEEPEYPEDQILMGYNIYRNNELVNSELVNDTFYNDEGLLGNTYLYYVQAVYEHCESLLTYAIEVVIDPQLCEIPVNVVAIVQENKAILTWDAPENIDGVLTGYEIYLNGVKIGSTSANVRVIVASGLPNGTYNFGIVAKYRHCTSLMSEVATVEIAFYKFCEAPIALEVVQEKDINAAKLTWLEPKNVDGTILGYNVYRGSELVNSELVNETFYIDENLENGTYSYQVSAVYKHCEESELTDPVEVTIFIPQFCAPPENVSVNYEENTDFAAVTWDEPENIDGVLLGYNIFRNSELVNNELISEVYYFDENIENGTYFYYVSAVYNHCESELAESEKVEVFVGINRIESDNFEIYPNPAQGYVTITGTGLNRVEIYDIQGRKIKEYININEIHKIEDLNKFDSGIYLIKLYSATKQVVTKRLTITK